MGDFYSLEDKYKKRKKDENYESEYGKNWRVASQKAEKVTSESVADMKAYYEGGK